MLKLKPELGPWFSGDDSQCSHVDFALRFDEHEQPRVLKRARSACWGIPSGRRARVKLLISPSRKCPAQRAGGRDGAREPSAQKQRDGLRFARGRGVRVSASEKLELIHRVESSSLSIRRTLVEIGLPRSTFYAWYKRCLEGGPEALESEAA